MKGKAMEMHVARTLAVALLFFGVGAQSADVSKSDGGFDASVRIREEASAGDVGLPAYPGSKPYKEPGDSSSGADVGLSSPLFGIKVAAVKLESIDPPRTSGQVLPQSFVKVWRRARLQRRRGRGEEDR